MLMLDHLQGLVVRLNYETFPVQEDVESFTAEDHCKQLSLYVGVPRLCITEGL